MQYKETCFKIIWTFKKAYSKTIQLKAIAQCRRTRCKIKPLLHKNSSIMFRWVQVIDIDLEFKCNICLDQWVSKSKDHMPPIKWFSQNNISTTLLKEFLLLKTQWSSINTSTNKDNLIKVWVQMTMIHKLVTKVQLQT